MEELRAELKNINSELFKLLARRKSVSAKIQSMKPSNNSEPSYPRWDTAREQYLFKAMSEEILKLSQKELLAFSLLVEDHAQGGELDTYPSFSQGEHLGQSFDLLRHINPILLTNETRAGLKLKANFQDSLSVIES